MRPDTEMIRSQKIRRFYESKDREMRMIAIAHAQATVRILETTIREESLGTFYDEAGYPNRTQMLETERKTCTALLRQEFILNNPALPFEICRSGEPLYVATDTHTRGRHRLYCVILADDEEALFLLSRKSPHDA